MKLAVDYINLDTLNQLKNNECIKYIIIGVKELSFNISNRLEFKDVNNVIDKIIENRFECILSIESLMNNDLLKKVRELFNLIDMSKVSYISYSDMGCYMMIKEYHLENKTILRSPTYLTNSLDISNYLSLNTMLAISSEIHINEVKAIIDNINSSKLCLDIFGQNPIFYSRRHLISSYYKYENISLNSNDLDYCLQEEMRNDLYPIVENECGTLCFEPYYYSLDDELVKMNFDGIGMIHVNSSIDNYTYLCITSLYNDYLLNKNINELKKGLHHLNIKVYKGAYDIESVLLKKESCNE